MDKKTCLLFAEAYHRKMLNPPFETPKFWERMMYEFLFKWAGYKCTAIHKEKYD